MANEAISQRPVASTLKDDDLLLVSQKQTSGGYLTCKVTADNLKGSSAYEQWVEYNTSENTYLTMQSIYQIQQVSNYSTVNDFITATNLTDTYNSWVENDYEVQNNYLIENNLEEEFNTYNSQIDNATFVGFIEANNLTSDYSSWLVTNETKLQTLFMQVTNAIVAYNSYVTTNQNTTEREFLVAIGAEDGFNAWLEDRVVKLTEDAFNSMIVGKNAKSAVVSKYEKFWISICGVYQPAPVDPAAAPVPDSQFDTLINAIVLPTDIFFEQHQIHHAQKSSGAPSVAMVSSTGFHIRDVGNYNNEDSVHTDTSESVELIANDDGTIAPFSMLSAGQRLYVKTGSTLQFNWTVKPVEETFVSLTLVVKKKMEADSDTAVVKLSGHFQIHDSINGWVKSAGGSRSVLSINQFAFFSDGYLFADDFLSNFFYTDFSAVATGYDPVFFQNGTVTVKNMSNVGRVLTLVPYNLDAGFISSIDENPNDLASNVEIRNGALVLTLAANQDS